MYIDDKLVILGTVVLFTVGGLVGWYACLLITCLQTKHEDDRRVGFDIDSEGCAGCQNKAARSASDSSASASTDSQGD